MSQAISCSDITLKLHPAQQRQRFA